MLPIVCICEVEDQARELELSRVVHAGKLMHDPLSPREIASSKQSLQMVSSQMSGLAHAPLYTILSFYSIEDVTNSSSRAAGPRFTSVAQVVESSVALARASEERQRLGSWRCSDGDNERQPRSTGLNEARAMGLETVSVVQCVHARERVCGVVWLLWFESEADVDPGEPASGCANERRPTR